MIGITIDSVDRIDKIVDGLKQIPYEVYVRVCCDPGMKPEDYDSAVTDLSPYAQIIIQPVDSSEIARCSIHQYVSRNGDYIRHFNSRVYAFEVGNEINGDWCGPSQDTMEKVNHTMSVAKVHGVKTMITMYAQGTDEKKEHDTLAWLDKYKISEPDISGLSIYPFQWNYGHEPDVWNTFEDMAKFWPNALQVIGEFGWDSPNPRAPSKAIRTALMQQFYHFDPPSGIKWGLGGFYWEATQDMDLLIPVLQKVAEDRLGDNRFS